MDGESGRRYRYIEASRIAGSLGAEITGVDLAQDLTDEVMGEIRQALLDHLVIFFRDQALTPPRQVAFARRWGDIHYFPLSSGLEGYPEILEVKKTPEDEKNVGNFWHTDQMFTPKPAMVTILHAKQVPTYGGDTMFSNQYTAYETLSDAMKRMLACLKTVRSSAHLKRGADGKDEYDSVGTSIKVTAPAKTQMTSAHPVVRTHPDRPQGALHGRARPQHRRHDGRRKQAADRLPDAALDAGGVDVPLSMAHGLARHLGQPLHAAPRAQRLSQRNAPDASHHRGGRHAILNAGSTPRRHAAYDACKAWQPARRQLVKRFLHCFFCAMLLMCTSIGPAVAQGYPNRPIHMIVPYPTAGGVDKAGRLMAELLSAKLGQPIVVDNKPGAASALGIEIAAKAVPDGYTILMTNSDGITMLPNLKKNIPYAVPKDFTFIARMLLVPLTVSISTKMPFNSMADLIAYAKANPGKLRYGTPGVGSGPHLATLLLEKAGGIKLDHIPYRGSAASMNDLLGGHIEVSLNAVQAVAPLAAGGKIKMLAVTGPTRDAFAPELPTLAELGMPGATVAIWYGILGPANMPPAIVDRLRKDMMAVLTSPEAKQKFMAAGFQPDPLAGDDFEKFVMDEYRTWNSLADAEKITIED